MTLIVEDGTGLTNATAYASLVYLTEYHTLRGNLAWLDADPVEEQEPAAVRATFGLDYWLRQSWKGSKKTATQRLAWPRIDVVDEDGFEVADDAVPVQVKDAFCEISLIELTTRFYPTTQSKADAIKSQTVGPITTVYKDTAPTYTTYPHIEAMLSGLADVGGNALTMHISLTEEESEALAGGTDVFDYEEYFNLITVP